MDSYYHFDPELIVEVTRVCDRRCPGCYAPNLVSSEDPRRLISQSPNFFLRPGALRQHLSRVEAEAGRRLRSLSFRGGEPSRHPELPVMVRTALGHARRLYLETHAFWVTQDGPSRLPHADELLESLAHPGAVVKISFDSMHGMSALGLKETTRCLDERQVDWLVAITEDSLDGFTRLRAECGWVSDSRIIFHHKVARSGGLYSPPLGVIRADGEHVGALSTKPSFELPA